MPAVFFSYKALEVSGKPRLSMSAVNSLFRDILVNGFKDAVPQETPILLYCSGSMGLGKCCFCLEDMVPSFDSSLHSCRDESLCAFCVDEMA